jgi:carbamoylphosphate synthase large subunit
MNYFMITGFENGEPIEPYGVATYSSHPSEVSRSHYMDSAIYYEPITKEEYYKLVKKEEKELENDKKRKKRS